MTEPVKIYMDHFSQPSRAVLALCLFNKIPHTIQEVQVLKGQHFSPAFKKVNPLRQVPAIDDNGFYVTESHAILRYLCDAKQVADHWYPKDFKKRAIVNRYLDWHHGNTRRCARYFQAYYKNLFPPGFVTWNPEDEEPIVQEIFKTIENVFLKDTKYLASDDEMTIADLSAVCEIMQLKGTKFDFTKFPKLVEWLGRCMAHPEMKEVHQYILKLVAAKPKL